MIPNGRCKQCGKKLRAKLGPNKNGHFCTLRCGYHWALNIIAQSQRPVEFTQADGLDGMVRDLKSRGVKSAEELEALINIGG